MSAVVAPHARASVTPRARSGRTVRVTHVVFDFDGGGLESIIADMAAAFRGSSVEVSLVTLSGRTGRLGVATRDRFHDFEVVRPLPAASMALPTGLTRAIRKTRPDVVHLHTGAWFKGVRAARLADVKRIVYTEHGREHWDPWLMRALDGYASRKTDAVAAVSSRLAAYLVREVGVARHKICTIHNAVDTDRFAPGPPQRDLRRLLEIPADALVLGSIGRLETVKAYETFLEAAAMLRGRLRRPLVVVLFGGGSQRSTLEARANQLGMRDVVRFAGWTDRPVDAYRVMDVFVLSSRSEGQSVSLLEAMACGVAPAVTDVGANAETLGADLRAQVVRSDEPRALCDALLATLRSEDSVRAIGARARARVVELYSRAGMIERYENLYRGAPMSAGVAESSL